ncbi:MAG: hypothetical protein LUC45_04835 [Paraprevotella sp.]|nr:hypothetical protein [Paraprevotella sp.]
MNNATAHFEATSGDRGSLVYIGKAATYGLLARTYLYLEQWNEAAENARKALDETGITTLTYGNAEYKAPYNNGTSNVRPCPHEFRQLVFQLLRHPVEYLWFHSMCVCLSCIMREKYT